MAGASKPALEIARSEALRAVLIISPRRFTDARGFFSEVWRRDALADHGVDVEFVQDNHALSTAKGTIRGLHFQIGTSAQAKLVRCSRGRILDVAVDIRHGSPTFGLHVATVLSAENWKQLYVPSGFAHGYCTLEPETEVIYKVNTYYDPGSERGLAFDDPALSIPWPVDTTTAVLAPKDLTYPKLAALQPFFPYSQFPDPQASQDE